VNPGDDHRQFSNGAIGTWRCCKGFHFNRLPIDNVANAAACSIRLQNKIIPYLEAQTSRADFRHGSPGERKVSARDQDANVTISAYIHGEHIDPNPDSFDLSQRGSSYLD